MKQRKRINPYEAVDEIYALCNKKRYFTCGCSSVYTKMFDLVRAGRPISEIATAIWVCSDENFTYSEVFNDVKVAITRE